MKASKTDALRGAIAALGPDAANDAIRDYCEKHYRVVFGPEFSTMKSQVRKTYIAGRVAAGDGDVGTSPPAAVAVEELPPSSRGVDLLPTPSSSVGDFPPTPLLQEDSPAPPGESTPAPLRAASPEADTPFLAQLRFVVRLVGPERVKKLVDDIVRGA